MNPLPSVAAIYEQVDQARRAGPLVTNFYPVPDKLQRSVARGELFSTTIGGVVFVLRRDRDFLHLSYVARSAADLAVAVNELAAGMHETFTVDVLGKRAQVDEIAALFERSGFHGHCTLHRMTKTTKTTTGGAPHAPPDPEVVLAGGDDAAALAGMLEAELDRFAEQIPDEDELRRAATDRKILIVRSGPASGEAEVRGASPVGSIAGLLVFEVTGQSSLLRHWVVDAAHRDRRVGARLMRRYFADCQGVRRFVLWVISDNDNAIDRYKHYGYEHDGLIDQVLIRRAP